MDLPISIAVIKAVQSTAKDPIVKLPTSGGSLPLSIITDRLRTVTITVPIVNYDNISTPRTRTCGCKFSGTGSKLCPR